jgi:urease accessory protein
MTENERLLALLQHGDSFFPAGSFAFSWGLETLIADGQVRGADAIARFVATQLEHRWATFDRVIVAHAHRARDAERLGALDALVEAASWPRELREGSRRAGRALLGVHGRLGAAEAQAYQTLVREGSAHAHLAVVQGLVWRLTGLDETAATALAAYQTCVGLASAAVRLGAATHIDAQAVIGAARPLLVRLLARPIPDPSDVCAFTPATEIAMMRHERQATRLFAN